MHQGQRGRGQGLQLPHDSIRDCTQMETSFRVVVDLVFKRETQNVPLHA